MTIIKYGTGEFCRSFAPLASLSFSMYRPGLMPDSDSGLRAVNKQYLQNQQAAACLYNSSIDRFHRIG